MCRGAFLRRAALIASVALLAGCVTNDCDWAEPIYPSPADDLTDETADAILIHNETGAAICGWSALKE